MPASRKAEIHKQTRLFDDFFKIDEVMVSHERRDGTMSPDERRLIFERGDAAAIMLFNVDTKRVVLVNQFKAPTLIARRRDDPQTMDGWITEATAGMIERNETPEATIIRETQEETGYRITDPKLIATFFSSPGGTSERIFLYYKDVRETDRIGEGGGLDGEDITVVEMPLNELLERLVQGSIDDPKLAIGAYWMKDRLKASAARTPLANSVEKNVDDLFGRLTKDVERWLEDYLTRREHSRSPQAVAAAGAAPAPAAASGPLPTAKVRYELKGSSGLIVGYITGRIDNVSGVSIWANSENTDMLMDRFIGRSISARIRYLGSNRDEEGNVLEDTVAEALRSAVGSRGHVKLGTVLVTESGSLKAWPHGVQRIFHVASVEAAPGAAIKGSRDKLQLCIEQLLRRAEIENKRTRRIVLNLLRSLFKLKAKQDESILIPMIGSGEGGLSIEEVARLIIPPAVEHLRTTRLPTLKEIYFLAFSTPHRHACEQVFKQYCEDGALVRLDGG